ncbi:MAG TPA: transglutaminase-like domain-containing protein, partial [Burkholderiaceae bacterium]|nr:transglutaminase-like domain-containing protein [Burkholderiaceae bacterium]
TATETALPPGRHPRTRAWAQAWAQTLRRDAALGAGPTAAPQDRFAERASAALLAHIRRGGYQYTLAPGLPEEGADPVDAFWLDQREGFCEHYAVAFVVVMRSLGVPARIVTGYQGGQPNALDGWLDVRQSDAHAWAEIWQPGRGWLRVDPTAAVAPERIRLGQRLRPPPGLVAGAMERVDPALLERLRQAWRAADHRWSDWVLRYGRQRQADLLRRIGWDSPDLFAAARTLLIALALLGLAGAAWAAWDGRRRRQRDPWLRALEAVQVELQRHGLADATRQPPRSLAHAVQARWGHSEAGQALTRLLLQLDAQRYAPPDVSAPNVPPLPALQRALRAALRRLPESPGAAHASQVPSGPPPSPG